METYHGHVRTPADAIILFEACRIGLLPRVQRRLSEKERQSIKSGSVFVWDEREAGMRRWTDGKSWSASRVSGSFLTYREMEGKRGGSHAAQASRAGKTPDSTRGSDEDGGEGGEEGPDGYRYKPDGLMKQSFSITTSTGQHLHLISYYARSHPTVPGLNQPSTDPSLRHIQPQKGLYPESSVNDQQNLPVVTRGPMAGTAFSVPPPVQHYARPPAAHPHGYSPTTYNWPVAHPPPMNGQPPHPAQPGYPPGSYLPPLSGANGPPQYQYAHPQHPHMPPSQPVYPPQYDRPHPADPPPGPVAHASNGHSASPRGYPYYATARSPSHPQAGHMGPGEPVYQAGSKPDSRHSVSSTGSHSPREAMSSLQHTPMRSPGLSHINRSPQQSSPQQNGHSHVQVHGHAHAHPLDVPPPASSATAVPSINALMNGPPLNDSARIPGYHQGVPAPGMAGDGPKDIPSEKIGFGEDMRALRQLDRVFTA
ncbi:TPA_exp: Extracellular proline rich protein [Trichophyton benhamiae CBS 112371]|uniref:Extracellular proline rich protein n=1 Tax=Arthroderma benhamiae (strain ATCC MYA-4681 / CBS 112371) TaxID=663331 RepID=D4AYC0_ARTBC|nr:extracellular proline rich protein [Trichophyton benhamiae CBS 112371]EFE31936.1 extracellular proline rich protein [Trichophyton benhamiae CBS 112371]DAA75047.1 TPA_exp: Extracellular proline rich protein [Trichophyton benhamiae CBS 112371]